MIKMRKITRKVIALASAFAMTLPMFSTTAFAKELPVAEVTTASNDNNGILPRVSWVSVGTYGAGEYQMEYVNFKDKTNGAIRTYNTQYMRIKPAWKATDSSTSEVELLVKVIRKSNGDVAYSHRFKLSEDTDGHKDGEGWWYAKSAPFKINKTSDYFFYYEVFTADGYKGTGNTRSGEAHLWVELRNGLSEFK